MRVSCGSFVSSSEPVQTRHGHGSFYEEVAVELKDFIGRSVAQLRSSSRGAGGGEGHEKGN